MRRLLLLLSLLGGPALAQTAPIANSINTTNAGQATGTVLNSNQQINQIPVLQQEFGAGFRCQSSTLSLSPYVVGSSTSYGIGSATGIGGMATISVPLDGRGVELCVAMARARVAKEQFDLAMTKAMRCADLVRAGITFTTPESQELCAGIAYDPRRDATKGAVLPEPPRNGPPQVILTR